jgi:hypothetical protein
MTDLRNAYIICVDKPEEMRRLEDLEVDGRIILKLVLYLFY